MKLLIPTKMFFTLFLLASGCASNNAELVQRPVYGDKVVNASPPEESNYAISWGVDEEALLNAFPTEEQVSQTIPGQVYGTGIDQSDLERIAPIIRHTANQQTPTHSSTLHSGIFPDKKLFQTTQDIRIACVLEVDECNAVPGIRYFKYPEFPHTIFALRHYRCRGNVYLPQYFSDGTRNTNSARTDPNWDFIHNVIIEIDEYSSFLLDNQVINR